MLIVDRAFHIIFAIAFVGLAACGGDSTPGVCDDCADLCTNGVQDGAETGVDCGGTCGACTVVGDCTNGVQDGAETGVDCGGTCVACTVVGDCTNGIQDGAETGVDCGGSCSACLVEVSCSNGTKDGAETDIDCGGVCLPCGLGEACAIGADCAAGVCDDGVCVDPTCDDGVKNGFESDVDCGPGCEPCSSGRACGFDADCEEGGCEEGLCTGCDDGVKNGPESGVDCGGDFCAKCEDGVTCAVNNDCASGTCADGLCAGCHDGIRNRDEEDVDCGGESCGRCLALPCEVQESCYYGMCVDGICAVPEATALSVGDDHACVIAQEGRVFCWGSNDGRKSGITGGPADIRVVGSVTGGSPARLRALDAVTHVFAGPSSTCAGTAESVYCWGLLTHRPIGSDVKTSAPTPETIFYYWDTNIVEPGQPATFRWRPTPDVTALGVGADHVCMSIPGTTRDSVYCWGDNTLGQLGSPGISLGIGTTGRTALSEPIESVVSGRDHNCALTDDGGVACWGANDQGQSGQDGAATVPTASRLATLDGTVAAATAVYAKGDTSCALVEGAALCWGQRPFSVSGATSDATPVAFGSWSGATRLALGEGFACALVGGSVSCVGEPGTAMGLNRDTAREIGGLSGSAVVEIAAGADFACALMADQGVRCWGENGKRQLGDGTQTSRPDAAPWVF